VSKFSIVISNSGSKQLRVFREPWGDEYKLPCGTAMCIQAEGPDRAKTDRMQIQLGDGEITIYGWAKSSIEILAEDTA
jgi:hypothetical protein